MCGIFGFLNKSLTPANIITSKIIEDSFNKGKHRGPDNSSTTKLNNLIFGFHRLAINGLDSISNQPIVIDNIYLICNGEIYNYKKIYEELNIIPQTNSDCEAIIHLYKLFGIETLLNMLDGVFSFILYDEKQKKIFVSRDAFGVRPLYILGNTDEITKSYNTGWLNAHIIGFSSELKQLSDIYHYINNVTEIVTLNQFIPGTYMDFSLSSNNKWYLSHHKRFFNYPLNNLSYKITEEAITQMISNFFTDAVKKRIETTERPISCLLSGGLDSSIVAAIVSKHYNKQLETYSIGLPGSEDLKYAKIVSNYLGTKHTEIVVTEEDFFNAIPDVIYMIESYDTTTVRASVGNYLVAKYIAKNSEAKVIFNGDGSDELMGGYLYMNKAPNHLEFDKECKRLLSDIYLYDVLRSDRSISTNGLEPRTPFLDRKWVEFYLNIPSQLRFESNKKQEKYLFRKAFENSKLLPDEILWRRKEAFSDGVSSLQKSWYEIINDKVNLMNIPVKNYYNNNPKTNEQRFYRELFEKYYKNLSYNIPYFWMPKYINATDASARTLSIY